MTIWQAMRALVRISPRLYALSLALQVIRLGILVVPGVIINAIFDALTGHARASWGLPALIALLVGITLPRVAALLAAVATEYTCYFLGAALVRRNLLARMLARPGARALPFSIGDAVSRFNWDVRELVEYLRFSVFVTGALLGSLVAIMILLRVDVALTLLALAPLLVAGLVVTLVGGRLQDQSFAGGRYGDCVKFRVIGGAAGRRRRADLPSRRIARPRAQTLAARAGSLWSDASHP